MASDSISPVVRPTQTGLASPEQLTQELAAATTPDRALVVRERAKILAHLVRRRGAFVDAWKYHRIRLDAERKTGDLLPTDSRGGGYAKSKQLTSRKPKRGVPPIAGGTDTPLPTGLSKQAAHVYRTLAGISDDVWNGWNAEFELALRQLEDENKVGAVLREHTTQSRYAMARQLLNDPSDLLDEIRGRVSPTVDLSYPVLVIDPPWPMTKIKRDERPNQVGFDYPTMTETQLTALELPMSSGVLRPINAVATDSCHVWLWTTHKFLPMGFRLLDAWGFKYVCGFVWHKPGGFQPVGLPQYNCEFALYAHKGAPVFRDTTDLFTCFEAKRGAHSEKPDEFFETISRVTEGPRLEVFARRVRVGFDGWGNEVTSGV